VGVFLGNGDGTFQPVRRFSVLIAPRPIVVGDFNGDGIPDLAVGNQGSFTVSLLLGNGDGTFQSARNFPAGTIPDALAVADLNGDGLPDLAVADFAAGDVGDTIGVLLGNGDGSFQPVRFTAAGPSAVSVAVGDVNGAGLPDLAVVGPGGVKVLLGNGDGSFQPSPTSYLAGADPVALAVADFDGDGALDLAVANSYSNDVSILLNHSS
jgi:hypothetical protein